MIELDALDAALDAAPAPVHLWWRDDDAGRLHPRLDRLLALAERHDVPVALAVVPAWLELDAAARIGATATASVLQHGHAHVDHAAPGGKRIELGGRASPKELGSLLDQGRTRLAAIFGDQFLPVMVPPWNRIAPEFVAALGGWGFSGLSTFAGAAAVTCAPLRRIDAHIDVIAWRGDRAFIGLGAIFRRLATLVQRRDPGPIGVLTHHLVTDDAGFEGLDQFLGLVQDRPKLRLASARDLFREAG
jgi:peptidoglycan/xylan/chitin deacetylase (PgdA/CDA1 family)